ncbi:DUF4157 domain-containing protein [Myceligenerans crystallogenes]|uniref:eCIS core domain-containing protein n=1 Tax=Myceligenerans crystallogenes TaxID=316335 RepID=A0ABN2N899_9MICO
MTHVHATAADRPRPASVSWGSLPRSGGRPVHELVRTPVPAHDVGDVRVHDDSRSRRAAARLGARAFTVGRHIYVGRGALARGPGATERLLRHELGHAVTAPAGTGPVPGRVPRLASAAEEARARAHTELARAGGPPTGAGDVVGLEMLFAQTAADQVQNFFDGAGTGGDAGADALEYLATLELGDLVDTAVVLDRRGRLEQVAGAVRVGDRSTVAAVLFTTIYLSQGSRSTPSWGIAAAGMVAALPATTRTSLLAQVLTSMGRGDEVAAIMEGLAAFEESETFRASQPEEVVEPGAAAATTAGLTPGPWNPGSQPVPFYIGNSAHVAIAAFYAAAHATDLAFYNFVPISSIILAAARVATPGASSATASQLALKPDIANVTRRHLYEIKPATAQSVGAAEAVLYATAFAAAGLPMALGPTAEAGTAGTLPAPGGWYVFRSPVPGVITYNYRQPPRRRVRRPVTSPRTQPASDKSLRQRISEITGLTGMALTIYLIISEGSRLFPPRNLIPVP